MSSTTTPATRTTYALGTAAEWWTTTLQQQDPDEVIRDTTEDADR